MTLFDKLQNDSRIAIENAALTFACNVEAKLTEEAKNGRTEYLFLIADEHKHFFASPIFISVLTELLEGVKVEVIEMATHKLFPSLKKPFLSMRWGELND